MVKQTIYDVITEEALIGVREVDGPESNPRIMEYLATTTIRATDDITPWCSALMNWAAIKAGYAGTDSAASASWYHWGKEVKKPKKGDLIGFIRQDGSGHIGIYVDEGESYYDILGGNQDDQIKRSKFLKKKSGETRRWYFRRPKRVFNSKAVGAAVASGTVAAGPDVVKTFTVEDLKKIKEDIRDTRDQVGEIKDIVTVVPDSTISDYLAMAQPWILIAIAGFLIYDRVKKMDMFGI